MTTLPGSQGELFAAPGASPEDLRANPYPAPGSDVARRMTAGSGRMLYASSPRSGPLGACLRILLDSERWASTEYYLSWRAQATPSGSLIYQLAESAPRTSDTAIGSWGTPRATDASKAGKASRGGDRANEPLIGGLVRGTWPTPRQCDWEKQSHGHRGRNDTLPSATRATWPTPQGYDGKRGGPQPIAKRKAGNHGQVIQDYLADSGTHPSTCLARTTSFAERLTTLSAWLMGYTAAYLRLWATASSRKSRAKSSEQ